ncbi:calcium-binding protein [Marinibacterium profundimaris]|uniref:calcium-binding protein n=1 Tax=Marinibacterium profundimaris TaxID=1679460 RepID=UPI000B51FC42|nr:calcium-binding protein [Marinibacterium profundimaris]
MGPFAFLLFAAVGVAAFTYFGDDDDDDGAVSDGRDPDLEEPQVISGTDGDDILSGISAPPEPGAEPGPPQPPVRILAGAGDDVLAGDDGDILEGGPGTDLFEVIVDGPEDAAPVVIEDLDFTLDDLQDNPDRVLFIQSDGQVVPYRGVLEAGLIAEENEDGDVDILYDDRVVAIIKGYSAEDLNTQSIWVGNFSPAVTSRLEGDDIFIGDLYDNKDDVFEGGGGNDVLIGGDGNDLLDGGPGNDVIDATDPGAPASTAFDYVSGGAGDDVMRGDDGDYMFDVRYDDDGGLVVDTEGTDIFEVVVPESDDADPVFVFGEKPGEGLRLNETLFLLHADGTELTDEEIAEDVEVEDYSDEGLFVVYYQGRLAAYVIDTQYALDTYGEDLAPTNPDDAGDSVETPTVDISGFGADAFSSLEIDVTGAVATGNVVPDALFGANAVYKVNTEQGDPVQSFRDATDALESEYIRFPAGQGDGQSADDDGVEWLNVVKMVKGEDGEPALRPELTDFLDWARDPDGDGDASDAKKVALVIPTKYLDTDAYQDFGPEIRRFTATVMEEYGDVVDAFEIGNEYWEMGETAYASKANIAIRSILRGFEDAGIAPAQEPDIIVQMGTPNAGSEFHFSVDDRGYMVRVEAANQQIIDTLSAQAKANIDGVVEHYYYNEKLDIFEDGSSEVNNIDVDYAVWEDALDRDLDLYLTEWNLKTSNLLQNGLKYTGVFSEQVEYAVTLGADVAHIWAVQHNTTTDLAGASGDAVLLDDGDRVVNTIRGATYDLMRDSLPGMENLELDYTGGDGAVEINGYYSDEKVVFYVASRVAEETHLDLDLSAIVPEFESGKAVRVSIDTSNTSSDGIHFVQGEGKVEAEYIIVGGERFYYGEHDTRAKLTDYTFDSNELSFDLKPYEMAELTFFLGEGQGGQVGQTVDDRQIIGTRGDDDLVGGAGNDRIFGRAGDDKLTGETGNDLMNGEDGNDRLYGWAGDDELIGGEGNDKLAGHQGDDLMKGQKGADRLLGGVGDDVMNGGIGEDELRGGPGADSVTGWTGRDTFGYAEDEIALGDRIEDFTPGEDVIELEFDDVKSLDDLAFRYEKDGQGVEIKVGNHGFILVAGDFTRADIKMASNFVFR